jgi:colanic acid biosynthesis protein WcaH
MKLLSDELYIEACKKLPILCVDALIIYERKYLLLKRNEEPLKNQYWVPGGRVLHQEKFEDALYRIVLRETGIDLKTIDCKHEIFGLTETIYDRSRLSNSKYHTPAIIYQETNISLDATSSGFVWSDKIPLMLLNETKKLKAI